MTVRVAPSETRPARLASLPKLPIFLDLQDKRVVVDGGGEAATWKAELLAAAGARVEVFAPEQCAELEHLAAANGGITIRRRRAHPADLEDAWLLVVSEEHSARAEQLCAAARSRGVLVNVIDQPALCDFQFGTIVNRAPIVIGISTDGAAPILGQAIRRRIEAVLPAKLGGWAMTAKLFRARLKELVQSRPARREFWEQFVNVSFVSQADEDARLEHLERLARDIGSRKVSQPVGEVVIVGAGPGDAELLTLRAVRELQAADVILYDSLVTPAVLEMARREARRILVGKRGYGAACSQQEISALMVSLAREGARVVRLKGGDPAVFGRTGEEIAAARAAGLTVRVVAGVTTASAAAATLGLSLTHREHAQRVQFVTGHDRFGALPKDLDLQALADPRATTVVYMGGRTIGLLATQLVARGLPSATPAIIISDVSRNGETRTATSVGELSAMKDGVSDAPAVILIGSVLREDTGPDAHSWQTT